MSKEIKTTAKKTPVRKSSKLKGLIASVTLPILGIGASLAPNKAEGATAGYGATADYRVSNIVQFFQGSSERDSGMKEALLSYKISELQNDRTITSAHNQFERQTSQLEINFDKAKNNAINNFRAAQQRRDVNAMVQAYSSLVYSGRSYIRGLTSAANNWANTLTNASANKAFASLRADQNKITAINNAQRIQSNSLDGIHVGAGAKQGVKGGSVGAGAAGSAGDVFRIAYSADNFNKANEMADNAQERAQEVSLSGTDHYNDAAQYVNATILYVQNVLRTMQNYIDQMMLGVNNNPSLKTKYENAKLDAQYKQEKLAVAEQHESGIFKAQEKAAQVKLQGERNKRNAKRQTSQNLGRALDEVGAGAKLRKLFGR